MRIPQLDILRSIAIFMVLTRHTYINDYLFKIGWAGVDLFFVLSGFLVSGLIFKEYQNKSSFSIKNFLIRRGLKIYPLFYVFIATSSIFMLLGKFLIGYQKTDIWIKLLSEVLFLQNYIPSLWAHTWSLAVEEHFYLILASSLYIIIKSSVKDKINWILSFLVLFTVAISVTRILVVTNTFEEGSNYLYKHFYPSHYRMDSLMFGAILSFFYTFKKKHIDKFLSISFLNVLALITGITLTISVLNQESTSKFMMSYGLTLLYIGFGIVLLSSLYFKINTQNILITKANQLFIFIGKHSYGIYLFHMFMPSIFDNINFEIHFQIKFILSIGVSIIAGVLMTSLIEVPVLKYRDRVFPKS